MTQAGISVLQDREDVNFPWFDHVMGTRQPHAGTERERLDLERRARRQAAQGVPMDSISSISA
jgi:hypothetical protein